MTEMPTMAELRRTILHPRHVSAGAKMVDFGGWEMPLLYPTGIVAEHIATRRGAGLFDVSHMGRFAISGRDAIAFLQHVLTNNAEALDVGEAQYTLIPTETGGAVDDAYLYRFLDGEYLLVVNAANREKDWDHFQSLCRRLNVMITDRTDEIAMLAVQGPKSREMLLSTIEEGRLPEPRRNALSIVGIAGSEVWVGRTGYTGEPLCFEIFLPRENALKVWDEFVARGATPVGLGARDTLRLEAALPLYGHELGADVEGNEIPIFACPSARSGVSFSPRKGDFIGREALLAQQEAYRRMLSGDPSFQKGLPRVIQPLALIGQGVARAGAKVFKDGRHVGYVTSGTAVPVCSFMGHGLLSAPGEGSTLRSICLAYIDSDIVRDERVLVEARGKQVEAAVVPWHLRSEAPPYARPIVVGQPVDRPGDTGAPSRPRVGTLLDKAIANTTWRQRECINLIPSEMTLSPMVRLLSVMDPAFRYAEHRKVKALYDADVFYYQGVDLIAEVERLLDAEMREFLGCPEVETRLISGQMANTTVYSGLIDYLNRADRRREPRRIERVMNHHISRGGHLSAQPMGALRDYVSRDLRTERPAIVNFPVLRDNPYQVDVPAALDLIAETKPELIIFGKSMVLHREPLAEVRRFLDSQRLTPVVMYDMAHVLGLIGPHFQEPFREGADFVTGSTHKTFFGTQRGVIGCRFAQNDPRYPLWEAVQRRSFPGSVSNHHLGTLLGLLMAAYEMNEFKDEYQEKVMVNAKAFAHALNEAGLDVAGDPNIGYTETHQVIVRVGYARGPELARWLEENNIICNYQAAPDEEGFTASGALRMGVAEMTRFGMAAADFQELAGLIGDCVLRHASVRDTVTAMRSRFLDMRYCFTEADFADRLQQLHALIQ